MLAACVSDAMQSAGNSIDQRMLLYAIIMHSVMQVIWADVCRSEDEEEMRAAKWNEFNV